MLDKLNRLGRKARLGLLGAMVAAFALVPSAAFAEETNGTDLSGVNEGFEELTGDLIGLGLVVLLVAALLVQSVVKN